jgi:PAS domain S-box-containing protein
LRQIITPQGNLDRAGDLIDAAISVNEAPTLAEAFRVLAATGLALLGADRLAVATWDKDLEHGVVTAGAGSAVADVGAVLPCDAETRAALLTGRCLASRPRDEETVVLVPLATDTVRATFEAGWLAELDAFEIEGAETVIRTLTRMSSLAERSRRENDQVRLESVLEGVADGVIVSSGTTATANAAARAILAVPEGVEFRTAMFRPRTLEGDPFDIAPDALPGHHSAAQGTSGRFKIRATALDGRDLVLDGSVAPVAGGAVIVFRDVTTEHARAVLNEQYLYALFNALPIPLTVGRADTRAIVDVNQAFLDLTGFERDEILGATPPFPWWSSEESASVGFETGSVVHRVFRRKDGRPVPAEVASHGVPGDDGETALLLGVITDLSEKRRLDQQLVQSGKLAAIGELAAGVAHEINNPLFAILGLTEFLLKESEPGSRGRQRLELIQQTGLEIKEIVRALLDFARENAEERHVVALEEVVQSTVDLVRRTNAHKGVELVDTYDADGALVVASPNQLKQIFLNLIANARQAMPDGGTVHVHVRRECDKVLATVTDDGPGIEPHVLERVFEPFFTTKRLTGGTGLGLSVSLGIAEAHGGTLTATSEVARGASFTLCLPVVNDEVGA